MAKKATTEEDVPPALRNRPVLNEYQTEYWRAYKEVSGSRQYTAGGPADIPYSEKILWLNENDITDQDERNDFLQMITLLDSAYLELYYEKHK